MGATQEPDSPNLVKLKSMVNQVTWLGVVPNVHSRLCRQSRDVHADYTVFASSSACLPACLPDLLRTLNIYCTLHSCRASSWRRRRLKWLRRRRRWKNGCEAAGNLRLVL